MTDELKLTPRQFDALDAVFEGQRPHYIRSGTYGDGRPYFRVQTNMGGAVSRMVEGLVERGFLSRSDYDLFKEEGLDFRSASAKKARLPAELQEAGSRLTAKGLRAFEAALAKKKFDPTDDRLNRVRAAIPVREKFEADKSAALQAMKDGERDAYARKQAAQHKALVSGVLGLLQGLGLNRIMDDAEVIQFVRDVREAEHGNGFVRFLEDADLSAMLDELEKEVHKPGTFGDKMRSEKVQAIRAELARRAEKAA